MASLKRDRLTYIENLIANGKYSSSEIKSRVIEAIYNGDDNGVSQRTIQRDIDDLKSVFSVEVLNERGQYFISNKDSLFFNDEESPKNLTYLSILSELAQMDTANNLFNIDNEELKEKLSKKKANLKTRKIIHWDENPEYSNVDLLPILYNAIIQNKVLKINYCSFTKEPEEYIFHPYILKEHENRWFVCGLNTKDTSRQFNLPLDRIEDIQELPEEHYIAQKEEWDDYYHDVVGTTVFTKVEVQEIVFFVKQPRCNYVHTKPIHHSQNSKIDASREGGYIFKIKVKPNRELTAKLYSFGSDLELISPYKSVQEIDAYINKITAEK